MTMTDGEREIAKQLKRIADALTGPEGDKSFADEPKPAPRFQEPWWPQYQPYRPYSYTSPWVTFTTTTATTDGRTVPFEEHIVPTESNNETWERIMRSGGEGDHLLNPDADHTGEDVE